MSNPSAAKTALDAKALALLEETLGALGGSVKFDARTPPHARQHALLAGIRDALAGVPSLPLVPRKP